MVGAGKGVIDIGSRRISRLSLRLAAVCLALMMLVGTADVLGIAIFSAPVPSATEVSEVLLALAVFLALMDVQRNRKHIAVDQLVLRLPPRIRWVTEALILVASFVVMAIIGWQASVLASASWSVREYANAEITFPIYPVKALVAAGALAAAIECLRQLVLHLTRQTSEATSPDV